MYRHSLFGFVLFLAFGFIMDQMAEAVSVTTTYGDNDGFGVGVFAGSMDPNVSNQTAGEAALTDFRSISTSFQGGCSGGSVDVSSGEAACGPFDPTGSFSAYGATPPITSAVLTLRTGSFDSNPTLDDPNRIYLDGVLVDPSFIDSFSNADTNLVETKSISLSPVFFPLLADGAVSLAGTHLSEAPGSGSFQVDFLKLEITYVPEPTTLALATFALLGMSFRRRK